MSGLSGARVTFSASHYDAVRKETHGHSYEVWAYWPEEPYRDAAMLQSGLKVFVEATFDHKLLPLDLGTAEAIARMVLSLLEWPTRVRVVRPVEGFEAIVER